MAQRDAHKHGDWVLHREDHSPVALYLPPQLASTLSTERAQRIRAEHQVQRAEAVAAYAEEARARDELAAAERAAADRQRDALRAPHRHHFAQHAVFAVGALEARIRELEAGLYGSASSKDDTATRELRALSAAAALGAHRSIVRKPGWRTALAELQQEMPAFRAAIAVYERALTLSEKAGSPPVVPPVLLVGPPGVGKSHFCRALAEALGSGIAWLGLDQPTAGTDLRGTSHGWGNARHGLLFKMLGLGSTANPLIVLDELDKAARSYGSGNLDVLAQLYSVLEPETSRSVADASLDVDMDASKVMYLATANGLKGLDAALLSRFEVVLIGQPTPQESAVAAGRMLEAALKRLGAADRLRVHGGCAMVLADYSPRVIVRAIESAMAEVLGRDRDRLEVEDIEVALGILPRPASSVLH